MDKRLDQAQKLLTSGRFEEAEQLCRRTIKLGRDVAVARRLLATCLYNQSVALLAHPGLQRKAEALLREAITLDSSHSQALNNLGSLLLISHRAEEAVGYLAKAAQFAPCNTALLENLAVAQQECGMHEDASASLNKLAQLDPNNATAYLIRNALLMPAIAPSVEYINQARARTVEQLARLEALPNPAIGNPLKFPSTYFRFSYHGISNVEINRTVARIHTKACPSLAWISPHIAGWRGPRGRIRIGIASRFLRDHSIGNTSRGLVEKLDRDKFEVVTIRLEPSTRDETARQIDRMADVVVELQPGDLDKTRESIAKLELDILFYQDIGMEPVSYFLAFARLAPVQLTSFGHPDTTGIPNLDYFVSSEFYERGDTQGHYTEKLVTLPDAGTLAYYHRPSVPGHQPGRAHFGLNQGDHVYCCPQMLFKIHPVMDRLFLGIAERDPLAVIVLIEPAQKFLRTALERRLSAYSPLLREKIRFLPTMPYDDYLHLLQVSDVILDTAHFNGQNTTLESFAMGTPVVTLPGSMQRERHGYGMYRAMDFMDLVAESETEFIDLAWRVANDGKYRDHCRERIESGASKLFENLDFVRNLEAALVGMVDSARAAVPNKPH